MGSILGFDLRLQVGNFSRKKADILGNLYFDEEPLLDADGLGDVRIIPLFT